jgi:hypothetical protein
MLIGILVSLILTAATGSTEDEATSALTHPYPLLDGGRSGEGDFEPSAVSFDRVNNTLSGNFTRP